MLALTHNQVVDNLRNIATAHAQIHTFGIGEAGDFALSGVTYYPLMYCIPQTSFVLGGQMTHKIRIAIMDIPKRDQSNSQEIYSDTMQIVQDIMSLAKDPQFGWDFSDQNIQIEPVWERDNDDVAIGWYFDAEISVPFFRDKCAVPQSGLSIVSPVNACPDGTAVNSVGTILATVPSGSSATVADVTHTQTDGSQSIKPAGVALVCTPCSVATVKNSDNSYNTTVASGATLTTPDITVKNSALTLIQTVPSVKNVSLADITVTDGLPGHSASTQVAGVNIVLTQIIAYRRPMPTGQRTSYGTTFNDDGYHWTNGTYDYRKQGIRPMLQGEGSGRDGTTNDWFLLDATTPNVYGNTNRFTDDTGAQTYTNTVLIDHLTGLMWSRRFQTANLTWEASGAAGQAASLASLSGWRMASMAEIMSVVRFGITNFATANTHLPVVASPLSGWFTGTGITSLWTNTTDGLVATTNARIFNDTMDFSRVAKTTNATTRAYVIVRNHYT